MQDPIITLKDFPENELFICLEEDYKNNLLTQAIKKAGSQRLLAIEMKKDIHDISIKQTLISFWLKNKNLRLDIIYWIVKYLKISFDDNKVKGIKGDSTTRMIYNPKLPIKLSPELASIVANLYCDSYVQPSNCYVSTYINTCEELISQFKDNFEKSFGKLNNFGMYVCDNVINVRIPCFIGRLLYHKFKLYEDRVPYLIISSNNEIKAAYIRAVFDDEGTVSKSSAQMRLKMKPK